MILEFLCLGHFIRNYNGYSHKTWAMHTSGWVNLKATINVEPWPTLYGSLTSIFFRVFVCKVVFSETVRAKPMKLGSCIHLEEQRSAQPSDSHLFKFSRLGHFLRNYKGYSHKTWVMQTIWRVNVSLTINLESWLTFHWLHNYFFFNFAFHPVFRNC